MGVGVVVFLLMGKLLLLEVKGVVLQGFSMLLFSGLADGGLNKSFEAEDSVGPSWAYDLNTLGQALQRLICNFSLETLTFIDTLRL